MNCSICGSQMLTSGCPQCSTRSRLVAYTFYEDTAVPPSLPKLTSWRTVARELLSKLPRCGIPDCSARATHMGPLLHAYRCRGHADPVHEPVPWDAAASQMEALLS